MTPAELAIIVHAWGGIPNLARVLHVTPRAVYYWLSGQRRITPMAAKMIRMLPAPSAK